MWKVFLPCLTLSPTAVGPLISPPSSLSKVINILCRQIQRESFGPHTMTYLWYWHWRPFSCFWNMCLELSLCITFLCALPSDLTSPVDSNPTEHLHFDTHSPLTHLHTWNLHVFPYSHLRKDIAPTLPWCWKSSKIPLLSALSSDWH